MGWEEPQVWKGGGSMMVKVHQTEKNHQCINVTRLMLLKKEKKALTMVGERV